MADVGWLLLLLLLLLLLQHVPHLCSEQIQGSAAGCMDKGVLSVLSGKVLAKLKVGGKMCGLLS